MLPQGQDDCQATCTKPASKPSSDPFAALVHELLPHPRSSITSSVSIPVPHLPFQGLQPLSAPASAAALAVSEICSSQPEDLKLTSEASISISDRFEAFFPSWPELPQLLGNAPVSAFHLAAGVLIYSCVKIWLFTWVLSWSSVCQAACTR